MKKWTYLVVAGLLAGATPMLQSCVDNDEPEGINVLRKAKAELIAAKKIVQEAEAARLKAEAAKLEADAELIKAQATIAMAQAELINAQTETERARLEQEIAEAKAKLEHKQKMWEIAEKEAEVAYQKALAELARTKAQVNAEQQIALSYYISMVDTRKSQYDAALKVVSEKQYALLQATEQVEQNEADKDLLTRGYAKDVKDAQKALDRAKAELAIWEKEYELVQALKPEEFTNRLDELNQQLIEMLAEQEKRCAALNEKKAELAPEYAELEELQAAADAAWNTDIEVDPFTYTFPAWDLDFDGFIGTVKIIRDGLTYNLATEYEGYYRTDYSRSINTLNNYISSFKLLARDENGRAWSTEKIAQMKEWRNGQATITNALKAQWADAVAAYRTGKSTATLANLKAIEGDEDSYGYADYVEAVKEYNTAKAAYVIARDALSAFWEAHDPDGLHQVYEEQRDAVWEEYGAAFNEAWATLYDFEHEHDKNIDLLENAFNVADAKWNEANVKYGQLANPSASDTQKLNELASQKQQAWDLLQSAINAYNDTTDPQTGATIEGTHTKAVAKKDAAVELAEATRQRKLAEINEAECKDWYTKYDELSAEFDPLYDAWVEASDKSNEAYLNAQDIYEYLVSRVSVNTMYSDALREAWDEELELEINDDLAVLDDKNNVEGKIRDLSYTLYGQAYGLSLDEDRLVELTKDDIDTDLEMRGYQSYQFVNLYHSFGSFGLLLSYDAQISAMEVFANMSDADYQEIIDAFQSHIDVLEAKYNAAVAAAEAADLAAAEKEAEIEEALAPVQEAHDSLADEIRVVYDLFHFYYIEVSAQHTLVARIHDEVKRQQGIVYEKETALMNAEKTLADWNNDAIDAVEAAQRALEVAQADADVAKENYDIALDRLQKAIEFMAVSAE